MPEPSDRSPSSWTFFDEDDTSTRPTRETDAEMYRGGGPITRDEIVAFHLTGRLRVCQRVVEYADDGTPDGPTQLWSITGHGIARTVDRIPDDLAALLAESGYSLRGSREWIAWRYLD